MDSLEKKPKRPRIGQNPEGENTERNVYDKTSQGFHSQVAEGNGDLPENPRPYQRPYQRPYNNYENRQGGYNNFHNRQGGYSQRPYQQRPYNNHDRNTETEDAQADGNMKPAYKPRENGYNNYNNNRQGGYNNYNNRQGGYNNRQQNGYNRQGGYNNYNNRQSGYNRPQGGGYNDNRQQGGYNRQGGYNNNNRQGGYNRQQNGYNRQGGFNNRQQGGYNRTNNGFQSRGKSFTPRPKRIEYEMPIPAPDEQIRLNKFLANAGLCSRREADEYIQSGKVLVNGVPATELGTKINHSDVVEYNGKVVTLESKCYILLNKPKDCVTTSDDPNGRLTVLDIVKGACNERIYPVGRLDRNTTGVLLLTNDGDLASKLTHPQYVKKKIYHVWTDKDVTEDDMQRIADGIELEDGEIHADAISYATETDRNQIGIEIHSGRNRIVRRIFESLGYHVTKLDRVYFAGLTKKNLPRGRWRYLTQQEVNFLKMGSFE